MGPTPTPSRTPAGRAAGHGAPGPGRPPAGGPERAPRGAPSGRSRCAAAERGTKIPVAGDQRSEAGRDGAGERSGADPQQRSAEVKGRRGRPLSVQPEHQRGRAAGVRPPALLGPGLPPPPAPRGRGRDGCPRRRAKRSPPLRSRPDSRTSPSLLRVAGVWRRLGFPRAAAPRRDSSFSKRRARESYFPSAGWKKGKEKNTNPVTSLAKPTGWYSPP